MNSTSSGPAGLDMPVFIAIVAGGTVAAITFVVLLYCCLGGGYTGHFFTGTIDEVRVWTRELPPHWAVVPYGRMLP